jgi:hypothetical protein
MTAMAASLSRGRAEQGNERWFRSVPLRCIDGGLPLVGGHRNGHTLDSAPKQQLLTRRV